jgi:hypothetical protein
MPGTANAHYLIEVDGVSVCQAQEVETGGIKHEPFKIFTGDRPNPTLGRAKYECEEVKIKQAMALNAEGLEFVNLFQNYARGLDVTKFNIRVVTLDEDGFSPIATDDYIDCVPTSFAPEGKKADSKDAAYFSIGFMPTDHIPSY